MRSIRLLAAVTSILALATACGGDGGGTPPPDNRAPVASFSEVCTALSCVFTDASTDPDEGGTIASRSWNFGEPASATNTSTEQNPTHVYAAAGTYTVVLTVTDNEGANSTPFSKSITVAAAPVPNVPPVAGFTSECDEAGACAFTNTSTDTDGTIATHAWNFGDPASGAANTSAEQHPTHTYAAVTTSTPFTVTLTVTDDDGATHTATQTVTINPPPATLCSAGANKTASCNLDLTQRSTLTVTVVSSDCEIGGNKFEMRQPIVKTVFFNGCSEDAGNQYPIFGADGVTPRVFEAGTSVQFRFSQGTTTVATGNPQIRLEGTYPSWRLNIDDGGSPTEPADFDDIVLTITATRVQ